MAYETSCRKTELTSVTSEDGCSLSVVIPVFNEEDNVRTLHQRLVTTLSGLSLSYEIIYVDDGSLDGSLGQLLAIADEDPNTVVVQFRRNFGQTAAMSAGIDQACGEVIVFMDADLQNDPADIPRLLAKLDEGYDLVSGWRENRQDSWFWRKLPSFVANRVISHIVGLHLRDYGCTLKACRSEILACIKLYGQMHRFIPAFVKLVGGRVAEISVNHFPRTRGESKYGIGRTFRVILDLLTVRFLSSYWGSPIYLFGGSGLVFIGLSVVAGMAMVVHKVAHGVSFVQTPFLLLSALLFLLGFHSILLGLAAELLSRTYYESQGKPTYVIRKVIKTPRRGG
ncbi:MAG TPA: glycosyltransferase family 2 protein [Desulfomonilaceae bacterium]|nr:glycosyltransferase family 2 protein [Desulfomonilaceae bacterium]